MKLAGGLLIVLAAANAARAGIYNSAQLETVRKAPSMQRGNVFQFLETLRYVRSIGIEKVEVDNSLRRSYFLCEALAAGRLFKEQELTVQQELNYSAVLIRRKKYSQAIKYLETLTRRHPQIFLFNSHLAMAYWSSGQSGFDRRAVESLRDVLRRGWPRTFGDLTKEQKEFVTDSMGWSEADFDFFRKTETYLLELMQKRLTEPAGKSFETVDPIFDDGQKPPHAVRFVNEAGKFEPGRMADSERRKLPANALEIVAQLTLWLPEDLRLYWLLGEVANTKWRADELSVDPNLPKAKLNDAIDKQELALDNLKATSTIFSELVEQFQIRASDLRERRQILREFNSIPRDAPALDEFDNNDEKQPDKFVPRAEMNTRTIATTFVAGMAVGIFAVWQFQEIRRRRRGR
jgi:hypothetical protein